MLTSILRLSFVAIFLIASTLARAADDTVTVFAAISLKQPLDKIGEDYTKKTGIKVVFSYGASGALAKQIENGAPAGIFASADTKWMDYLAGKKLIDPASRVNLLGNDLVLIALSDAPPSDLRLEPGIKLAKALGNGRLAMGNPATVPAGEYAEAALRKIGNWDALQSKLAMTENVRGALAFVARGEAPFGIVYKTDAVGEPKVKIIATFPTGSHPPIVYPFALTATPANNEAASAFLRILQSKSAQDVFVRAGFKWIGHHTKDPF